MFDGLKAYKDHFLIENTENLGLVNLLTYASLLKQYLGGCILVFVKDVIMKFSKKVKIFKLNIISPLFVPPNVRFIKR